MLSGYGSGLATASVVGRKRPAPPPNREPKPTRFAFARDSLQVRPLGPHGVFLARRNRVVEIPARRRLELATGLRQGDRARAPHLRTIGTIRRLEHDLLDHAIDPHGVTCLDGGDQHGQGEPGQDQETTTSHHVSPALSTRTDEGQAWTLTGGVCVFRFGLKNGVWTTARGPVAHDVDGVLDLDFGARARERRTRSSRARSSASAPATRSTTSCGRSGVCRRSTGTATRDAVAWASGGRPTAS